MTTTKYSCDASIVLAVLLPAGQFSRVQFDPGSTFCRDASVECQDQSELKVTARIENVDSSKDLRRISAEVILEIVTRLEAQTHLLCADVSERAVEISNAKSSAGAFIIVTTEGNIVANSSRAKITYSHQPAMIKGLLEGPPPPNPVYAEMLHHARASGNEIVEFLSYYYLLAAIVGDTQSIVDGWIVANTPQQLPASTPVPGRPGKTETVFTRLRNELMHVRYVKKAPRNALAVRAEVAAWLDQMRELAFIAVTSTP